MRLIITGLSGFIGQELSNYLKNHDLLLISKKKIKNEKLNSSNNINYINDSLENIHRYNEEIIDFNPDLCIYLSYHGIPDYSKKNSRYNYSLSVKFFKILKKTNVKKIICTGTCWEYSSEENIKLEKIKEFPFNNFASYKIKLFNFLNDNFGKRSVIWLRLFFVYGYNKNRKTLTNLVFDSVKKNKNIVINNKKTKCDFIFVKNVAYVINKFIEKNNVFGIYNVSSNNLISLNKFILNILSTSNSKNISIDDKKINNSFTNIRGNNTKLLKIIKKYPFGFKRSIEDLCKNLNIND